MTRTTALLVVAVAGLTACGGDKAVDAPITPSFAFTYSGAVSGSFSVTGATTEEANEGVAGFIETGIALVLGIKPNTTSGPMLALIGFTQGATGTVSFSTADPFGEELCEPGMTTCAAMAFIIVTTTSGSTQFLTCHLTNGALTLTVANSTRSAGTFSGTGICQDGETEAVVGAITVTGGSFSATYSANPLAG